MKLKTVAKISTAVSALLFCLAVGYYALMELDMAKRDRETNLYSLVPSDCAGVLETDNINAFLNDFRQLNYSRELNGFRFPDLFSLLLNELNEYTAENAHGLSSQMSRVMVSFHRPYRSREEIIYFRLGTADERLLEDMLHDYAPADFLPKEETYRGKRIRIYPLADNEFLASYAETGFCVVSYQKRLIEKVIDAKLDETSLNEDERFARLLKKKKTHNFLTLYVHSASLPFLRMGEECWSEYDFHMNSDVFYLTGETFVSDTCASLSVERMSEVPSLNEDGMIVSADKDMVRLCMEQAYAANETGNRTLFNECVANLSDEASFTLVADMGKVAEEPKRFRDYLPPFMTEHASLFRPFILSVQLSGTPDRLSHIWVFTYKD